MYKKVFISVDESDFKKERISTHICSNKNRTPCDLYRHYDGNAIEKLAVLWWPFSVNCATDHTFEYDRKLYRWNIAKKFLD